MCIYCHIIAKIFDLQNLGLFQTLSLQNRHLTTSINVTIIDKALQEMLAVFLASSKSKVKHLVRLGVFEQTWAHLPKAQRGKEKIESKSNQSSTTV